jgi:hypothetical protein
VALLAGLLLAANPSGKLVRLVIYNKTDFPVYIKLEGVETGAFYYLTVPGTTAEDSYIEKTFTILSDVYDRTTWACDGIKLIIVALLAGLLLAANPSGKLVRLVIYNKTEFPVYIKLEGVETGAFYYLTVPGTTDEDTYIEKTFTILSDVYDRTTWACDGIKSSGRLWMTGNVRLVFTPCGQIPLRWVMRWYDWTDWTDPNNPVNTQWTVLYRVPNFGEPTQEKVWYWKEYSFDKWVKGVDPVVAAALLCDPTPIDLCDVYVSPDNWIHQWSVADPTFFGHWSIWFHVKSVVDWRTYKGPLGVYWRYKY